MKRPFVFAIALILTTLPLAAHDVSGNYGGTYNFQYDQFFAGPCHPLSSTGTIVFELQHIGTEIHGLVTLDNFPLVGIDEMGNCAAMFQPVLLPIRGTIDGDYVELDLDGQSEDPETQIFFQFYGYIVGDQFDGYIDWLVEDQGTSFYIGEGMFSAGRGAAAPPRITSFEATPARVKPGEASRLVWSTEGASSVEITPSVGSAGPNGSAEVSPAQTTTYTLTAIGNGPSASASVTVEVPNLPLISVTSLPSPMVQGADDSGATTTFTLRNEGGQSTQISLSRNGEFFTQSPEAFTLAPGQSQTVTVTSLAVEPNAYVGFSVPDGNGVPPGLLIPVTLLAWPAPDGPTSARAVNARVDVSAPEGASPEGIAQFTNTGQAQIAAVVTSTVPWIVPPPGVFIIDPGETIDIPFMIDRSRRPEGTSVGSLTGSLLLTFRQGTSSKSGVEPRDGAATTSSLVTVVDTSRPAVSPGQIPPLQLGEVALFVPGVGHVQGSVGLFLSDVSLSNLTGASSVQNLDLYYTAVGQDSTLKTTLASVKPAEPVALADIVEDVFQQSSQVGSLQIRGNVRDVAVNATILNVSNPKGTFGTTIPTLRSDRSAAANQSLYLTGLRKTPTSHTNLYMQETGGGDVTVDIQYLGTAGNVLGTKSFAAEPFRLVQVLDSQNPMPEGTVSAILTARDGSTGRFSAYATPVDRASGDTWAVVDWNEQLGYTGSESLVIPVAGAAPGNNQTYFRTDVALMSRSTQVQGTLRYIPRGGGAPVEKTISLGVNETRAFDDIVTNFFGVAPGTVGFIQYVPTSGTVTLTSRTFTTVVGDVATFGSGTPTIAASEALTLGTTRRIGGVDDASGKSISDEVPATFRTNFGLVETAGAPVTVRVTLHFSYATGSAAAVRGSATRDYTLGPNGFFLINGIGTSILGDKRNEQFGDLSNLQVDFAVIGGDGEAMVFVSSVDNGTGDSILRTE